jgi:putative SOS response-associated peptidase YedK
MCGRYSIYEPMDHYLKELAPEQLVINDYDLWAIDRYNVAPTTRVEIIRSVAGGLSVDKVRWGRSPFWAKGKRPDPINARVETVTTGKFFKQLWPHGRVIAPANGWFEWVKDPDDPKKKQPYFIKLKSQAPMFFGALAQVSSGLEPNEQDGFVIITAASDQGMVDIHDRQPLVLKPELARDWLHPETDPDIAETICNKWLPPS